jgi:hypothetical protein
MRSLPSVLPLTLSGVAMTFSAPLSVPHIPALSEALAVSGIGENLLGELLFAFALFRLVVGFLLLAYATKTASRRTPMPPCHRSVRPPTSVPSLTAHN